MKLTKVLFLSALGFCVSEGAYAGSVSDTIGVSVNVIAACSVSTEDLIFPDYDTIFAVTTTGQIDVTCTDGATYEITLDAGLNWLPDSRRMGHPTEPDELNYQLYSDAGYTIDWGDSDKAGTTPWVGMVSTGTGALQSHVVYGKLFGSQPVSLGAYSDTVTVTVIY